jgi:hypothetical protein
MIAHRITVIIDAIIEPSMVAEVLQLTPPKKDKAS